MEARRVIVENWFTQKPRQYWLSPTLVLSSILVAFSLSYFTNFLGADHWMTASPKQVFQLHEYWRLWTTLLAHADLAHLFSNALLFLPLVYLLTAYFGIWLTLSGFFLGGITNWIVLQTLPASATLLGVSGVVYWMGAVWLTLFFIIDHRKNAKARFATALYVALMLFIPETYKPEVSYLSHFIGFVFGMGSAVLYYWKNRDLIKGTEVIETIWENDDIYQEESPILIENEASESIEDFESQRRWN